VGSHDVVQFGVHASFSGFCPIRLADSAGAAESGGDGDDGRFWDGCALDQKRRLEASVSAFTDDWRAGGKIGGRAVFGLFVFAGRGAPGLVVGTAGAREKSYWISCELRVRS